MKSALIVAVVTFLLVTVVSFAVGTEVQPSARSTPNCLSGAPLSEEMQVGSVAEARASAISMVTAWLRPTGVKSPPIPVNGMYVFGDTDVRVSFRDNGERITRVVTLTSTTTKIELDRLTRVASLFASGHSGTPEPEVRKDIGQAIANRRKGEKLIAVKMYGTLGVVVSAPEDDAVVISIERQKCN